MIYLKAEKQATRYYFKVQMDSNPSNVREFSWSLTPPIFNNETDKKTITEAEYIDSMKREIPLLVADELKRMNPPPVPSPLAGF